MGRLWLRILCFITYRLSYIFIIQEQPLKILVDKDVGYKL
nr:MAG TPA: hypothetical protein [Caudoviricetes sp.]